jgi:hypothetical protein
MPPFKLPNDNYVLLLKDIIKHGPTIITAAFIDIFNPYHDTAQLVFEADNFPEVSKGILREYTALAANGQQIKFTELVQSLLNIERYDQPKHKKVRMGRWVDVMSFERHHLRYGYTICKVHFMVHTLLLETRSQERVNFFGWTMVSLGQCSLNSAMSLKNAIRCTNVFAD